MIAPKKHLELVERISAAEPSRLFQQRLDRNERNQPFSPAFLQRIKDRLSDEHFMTYPETGPVYERMAQWLGLPREWIMLHPGSEQAIKCVFETYIDPGQRVLLHAPGFAMYPVYAKMFQAEVTALAYDSDLNLDWGRFLDEIRPGLRMVVVENPNGFLGVSPSTELVREVCERAREHGVLALVDEAYFHFHDDTAAGWLGEFDNLVITRTFSKAFGLAGLRFGYLLSQPQNIAALMKFRPAYEFTSFTGLVVEELLADLGEMERYVAETRRNLKSLREGFAALGIETSDAKANFLAARIGDPELCEQLRVNLREQGILIRRPFREPELKDWVRLSTAPPEVQEKLLGELARLLGR